MCGIGEESDECSEQAEIARDEADSSGVAQIFSGSNAYDVGNYLLWRVILMVGRQWCG